MIEQRNLHFLRHGHLIYLIIDIGLLVYFWKWKLKVFQTIKYARYKAVVLLNLIQGCCLMTYFKLKDIYTHL